MVTAFLEICEIAEVDIMRFTEINLSANQPSVNMCMIFYITYLKTVKKYP